MTFFLMIYGDFSEGIRIYQWKLRIWHDIYIYIFIFYKWVCIKIGGCSKPLKCSMDGVLPYIAAGFFGWWMRNKLCMEHLGWGWLLSFLILLFWKKGRDRLRWSGIFFRDFGLPSFDHMRHAILYINAKSRTSWSWWGMSLPNPQNLTNSTRILSAGVLL